MLGPLESTRVCGQSSATACETPSSRPWRSSCLPELGPGCVSEPLNSRACHRRRGPPSARWSGSGLERRGCAGFKFEARAESTCSSALAQGPPLLHRCSIAAPSLPHRCPIAARPNGNNWGCAIGQRREREDAAMERRSGSAFIFGVGRSVNEGIAAPSLPADSAVAGVTPKATPREGDKGGRESLCGGK
eukprot:9149264-Pyramimonas_sp.AAC.1